MSGKIHIWEGSKFKKCCIVVLLIIFFIIFIGLSVFRISYYSIIMFWAEIFVYFKNNWSYLIYGFNQVFIGVAYCTYLGNIWPRLRGSLFYLAALLDVSVYWTESIFYRKIRFVSSYAWSCGWEDSLLTGRLLCITFFFCFFFK